MFLFKFVIYVYFSYLMLVAICVEVNNQSIPDEPADIGERFPKYQVTEYTQLDTQPSLANISYVPEVKVLLKNISCLPSYGDMQVQIVNDTELIKLLVNNPNITNKETPANCLMIMFYSKYCPFSCLAAPYFNALPRAFPSIKMVAVDAMYHVFNVQNGVVGVPTLMLFHNSKPVVKYNESEYSLELFSKFITKYTGISPEEKSYVASADFTGPVSSVPLKENDFVLYLAWIFICICAAYYFSKTRYWLWIVESVQNMWRESEAQAQHEHAD